MKKSEKQNRILLYVIFGALFLFGAWYFASEWKNIVNEFTGGHENLTDVLIKGDIDDADFEYYDTDIDASLGRFASMTEGNDEKEAYFIVWLSDDSLAAAEVDGEKDKKEFDRIADETWAYVNGETDYFTKDTFKGTVKVRHMEGELLTMYTQTIEEMGITEDDFVIRDVLLDYDEGGMIKHDAIVFGIMGLIGLAGLVMMFLASLKDNTKESGAVIEAEKIELVSYKEAKKRITDPEIKRNYNKLRRMAALFLVPFVLLLVIPAGLYAYTSYANANGAADVRKAQYDISGHEAMVNAKENKTATISTDSVPRMLYSTEGEAYYLVKHNDEYYVAIIDSKSFSKIKSEIEGKGSYTLYGFLQEPDPEVKGDLIGDINSVLGTSYDLSDYDSNFGKYVLNVDEEYAGVGIPLKKIREFMGVSAIFIICFAIFGFSGLARCRHMINCLRHFSDSEYAMLEKELSSGNCERFPQNLILTENFIVMFYSLSAYKDSSAKENSVFFAKYSEIKWIYPANYAMAGKVTNCGVKVYGSQVGTCNLIGLPSNENGVATIDRVLSILKAKCSNAVFGYTEENKQKFGE
ncbi:MAG: hypothetical protein J5802_05115 [Butyrivibrio sp.]|nr:hypothetical protein [Butyrivibrio sp.]